MYRGYPRPAKAVPGDCGYSLHAHKLFLSHPITNEVLVLEKRSYHYDLSCLYQSGYYYFCFQNKYLQLIEINAPLPSILQTLEETAIVQQTDALDY